MSTPQFLFLQSIQLLITIFPQRPLPIPDISNVLYLRGNFLPWHKSQILALFRDNYVLTSPKSRALLQKNTSHLSFPQYPFSFFQTRPQIPCVSKLQFFLLIQLNLPLIASTSEAYWLLQPLSLPH